jgi:vacuolar-type H+-ATPase subunit E/Vma4
MPDSTHDRDVSANVGDAVPGSASDSRGEREVQGETPPSAAAFCEQIRKDVQEEIERILGKARLSASRRHEEAKEEAERVSQQTRKDAQAEAKTMEARVMSGVSLEVKKAILRAQGEIIDEVLGRVRARLKKLRRTKEYAEFLKELTAQGILALGEEECVLAPAVEDRELYTPELIDRVKQLVVSSSGKNVNLTVSADLSPEGSGVRVYSGAGTVLFDNTLEARMERLADELKTIVAREVFGEGKRGHGSRTEEGKGTQTGGVAEG